MGLLEMAGPQFLLVYGGLVVAAFILSIVIAKVMRVPGRAGALSDPDAIAMLAGGRARYYDATGARLLADGRATLMGRHIVATPGATGRTPFEQALLRGGPLDRQGIAKIGAPHAVQVEDALERDGFYIGAGDARFRAFVQVVPFLLLMLLGAAKIQVGLEREKPVLFLVILVAITAVIAIWRFRTVNRRTRAGIEAVMDLRRANDRLKRAAPADELGTAVALFGTAALVGSPYASYSALASSGGASGVWHDASDSSSDSGGDSGCSSGCGGCGGD